MQVSTTGPHYLICVYVADYSNVPDVRRVLGALLALDLPFDAFKPDLFTALGLWSDNQWGLKVRDHSIIFLLFLAIYI